MTDWWSKSWYKRFYGNVLECEGNTFWNKNARDLFGLCEYVVITANKQINCCKLIYSDNRKSKLAEYIFGFSGLDDRASKLLPGSSRLTLLSTLEGTKGRESHNRHSLLPFLQHWNPKKYG